MLALYLDWDNVKSFYKHLLCYNHIKTLIINPYDTSASTRTKAYDGFLNIKNYLEKAPWPLSLTEDSYLW